MIRYHEALSLLNSEARDRSRFLEVASVSLGDASGRVTSSAVHAREWVPAHDNSAMDGFAVRAKDLAPGKNQFRVFGRMIAGDLPLVGASDEFSSDSFGSEPLAIEIMTGALMPREDFDSVVKVEDCERVRNPDGSESIRFEASAADASFVRKRGTDFKPGDLIVPPGARLDAQWILGLAAHGFSQVDVFRKPRVAVISTGNELVDHDQSILAPGEIRNSTAPFLMLELRRLGCEVQSFGTIRDEAASAIPGRSLEFEAALQTALSEEFDLILTTGAVSMGVHDFVGDAIREKGGEVVFHRVAIKPGKPVLLARFQSHPRSLVLGLPGNPVSTVVGTHFFVEPYLRTLQGMEPKKSIWARLESAVSRPPGLRSFFKAEWKVSSDGESGVRLLPGQASFMIHSLGQANAWVVLPEEGDLKPGSLLEVYPFSMEGQKTT